MIAESEIWPVTAGSNAVDEMTIGGCVLSTLARDFGTPLYVLDEATIRAACTAYRSALAASYAGASSVHYAGKALLNLALVEIILAEGLGLDVVSGGELAVGLAGGMPADRIHLHGNAKPRAELAEAIARRIGGIVVDSLDELDLLAALMAEFGGAQDVLLRIAPDVRADTHPHIATGAARAKFGLPVDLLDQAATRLRAAPQLRLRGLHCHIGSQINDVAPFREAVDALVGAAARLKRRHGLAIDAISPGGGLAIPYAAGDAAPAIPRLVAAIADAVTQGARHHDLPLPRLVLEPGRSIVGRAGVALYSLIGRKPLSASAGAASSYLHVDGGIGDNIRPALYGARYSVAWPARLSAPRTARAHISGRYCESSDVLARDVPAPPDARPGDLIALAGAGAYTLSMASTYNLVPRPAVVLVADGAAWLIQRRETYDDLMLRDFTSRPRSQPAAHPKNQGRIPSHEQEADVARTRAHAVADR